MAGTRMTARAVSATPFVPTTVSTAAATPSTGIPFKGGVGIAKQEIDQRHYKSGVENCAGGSRYRHGENLSAAVFLHQLLQAAIDKPRHNAHQNARHKADDKSQRGSAGSAGHGDQRAECEGQCSRRHRVAQKAYEAKHRAEDGAVARSEEQTADDDRDVQRGGLDEAPGVPSRAA